MKYVWFYLLGLLVAPVAFSSDPLQEAIDGEARTAANVARDQFRHPYQTLSFFQLEPAQTVLEIWPGGGWYTEILGPYMKSGKLYAAHFSSDSPIEYFQKSLASFKQQLADNKESYSTVEVVEFDPGAGKLTVPDASADRVVTFRNVHNWLRNDGEQTAFELFYKALKPGGKLGVVEHRAKPGTDRDTMLKSGYMTEAYVIELAENAGFVLEASSEINANPKDSADHPNGVWTLPPRLRIDDEQKAHYQAIGESDRMTLLFRKP